MATDSEKPGFGYHLATWIIVGVAGYFFWYLPNEERKAGVAAAHPSESSQGSVCEAAIKEGLRNPSSASISFIEKGPSDIGTIAYFEVRAQNGFGGFNAERWACFDEDGQKVAMPW